MFQLGIFVRSMYVSLTTEPGRLNICLKDQHRTDFFKLKLKTYWYQDNVQHKLFCCDQLGPISYKLKVEHIAICKSSVKLFVAETFCEIDPWQENHKDQPHGVKGRS